MNLPKLGIVRNLLTKLWTALDALVRGAISTIEYDRNNGPTIPPVAGGLS